jgi:hypothetical protein
MKADRYNEGKPKWSLVHFESLIPMVRVLEKGAEKYSIDNWKKDMELSEIQNSMMRHLAAIMDGETHDKETGELHMGHIMSNAMFWNYHYNKNRK